MNGQTKTATRLATATVLLVSLVIISAAALGQVPVDESGKPLAAYPQEPFNDSGLADGDALDAAELEELIGPIALYPDDLLAIILPASTYPLEIVEAVRFLDALEQDDSLEPDEEWDDSVVALLNYPEVLRMLDENIDWTWKLGDAVLAQQDQLIAAVESFRDRAYAAGNLKTDEHQEVTYENGSIEIVPVDDEIIYVPYYEPTEVVVSQPRRVYHYYPEPYPVYYYPYPSGHRFRTGFFWGVTTAYTIGWPSRYLHVYHPSYWGHPYYGRYYYGHYYRRPSITVYNTWYLNDQRRTNHYRYRDGDRWRHRRRAGTTVVNNYHYNSNGSRNSRDYTVTRRDRFSVNNGRDVTQRREATRNSANTSRTSRSERGGTTANRRRDTSVRTARERNTIEFRDRRASVAAVDTSRQTASRRTSREDTARNGQQASRDNIRFRERGNTTTRPSETRQATAAATTRSRQQNTGAATRFRERGNQLASRQHSSSTSRPATTNLASSRQQRTASATNSRQSARPATTVSRPTANANRQRSAAASRSITQSSRPARTPRASAPSTPRVQAPAASRAPARSNNRASARGESRTAPERRSSGRRNRQNND